MKVFTIKHIGFFIILGALLMACAPKDPIADTNDKLDGRWEAISFKLDDNVERITGDVTKNSILFQKDSVHTGLMSIDIVTTLVTLQGWSGPYTLTDDGNRLNFGNMEFLISFDDDLLNMNQVTGDDRFYIQAERKD
jgi:hypothetical protein